MRFSRSTHLLMFLYLETLTSHKDWLTYSGGTDQPGELCYNFSITNDLIQMVNFPTQIPDCDFHNPALLDLFLLTLVFVLQWLSLHCEILIMFLSELPLTFHHIHNRMSHFITLLTTILVVIGTVFIIIWKMFHGRISLKSVLLLLLMNFVVRLELMYISLIESISQVSLISMVFSCFCWCHNS